MHLVASWLHFLRGFEEGCGDSEQRGAGGVENSRSMARGFVVVQAKEVASLV